MLLMQLKTEEKFAFLKLAQYIAKLDGEYKLKEQEIMDAYCQEMGIENVDYALESLQIEDLLTLFQSQKSQRIVLLALMVIIHIDDKYGLYEHKSIAHIARHFGVDEKELHLFSMWGKSASAIYEQALAFVEE